MKVSSFLRHMDCVIVLMEKKSESNERLSSFSFFDIAHECGDTVGGIDGKVKNPLAR